MTDTIPAEGRFRRVGPGGYGHQRDPDGHRVTSSRVALGTASPPDAASLAPYRAPIVDQLRTSQCVGCSWAGASCTTLGAQGTPIGVMPSPTGIYTGARALARAEMTPDGIDLPKLDDTGTQPNYAARWLAEYGIGATIADWPIDESKINDEPSEDMLQKESRILLVGQYEIATLGAARVQDAMRAIAAGFAVTFAIDVDQSFEDYKSGGVLSTSDGTSLGGHALYCYEYSTTKSGVVTFRGANSWGEEWGDDGSFLFDATFCARWFDAYILRMQRAQRRSS